MFNPFRRQAGASWQRIGLTSELPDLVDDENYRIAPRCKAFTIPKEGGPSEQVEDIDMPGDMKEQVLVFKYKGKVHAVDHVSKIPGPLQPELPQLNLHVAMPSLVISPLPGQSFRH
jgi:hypothetical protein